MLKLLMVASAALSLGIASAKAQTEQPVELSEAECLVLWQDESIDGTLSEAQAEALVLDFEAADQDGDGELSSDEFLAACLEGNIQGVATIGPGTGTR